MVEALSKAHSMKAFEPRGPLRGTARIPGDKSISHRALMLAALAVGESRIDGLSDGGDVSATVDALRAMGAQIRRDRAGCTVEGVGVGGLLQPEKPFALGNSGTSARLLMGLITSHPIRAIFTGDPSLSRRPMERIAKPLRSIGARFDTAPGGRLPLTVEGIYPALPRRHALEIPSAQLKSALLLAGLNLPGTTIVEAPPSRDHLERLDPVDPGLDVGIEGLDSEADAGDPRLAAGVDEGLGEHARVQLGRHLGPGPQSEPVGHVADQG